jgi:hypothetical protein
VKWKDGDNYGIGFNHSLKVCELMAFLQERQRDERLQAAA